MFFRKLFINNVEKDRLISILKKAHQYAHTVIKSSATLPTTPIEDVVFIDDTVSNMRMDIFQSIKSIYGYHEIHASDLANHLGFSDPLAIEIKKRHIEKSEIGNCGEFVILALAYLLAHHKKELKNYYISVMASGPNLSSMSHAYLRIFAKNPAASIDVLFDPSCRQIDKRNDVRANIFIRSRHGKPNRYRPFIEGEDVEKEITRIDPVEIMYPLSKALASEVDEIFTSRNAIYSLQ